MSLDPIQTTFLVLEVIEAWLKDNGAGSLKEGKTINGKPPKGYGMSMQRYKKFCDDISETLSQRTKRRLVLKAAWRTTHYSDTMGDFASAVTTELLASPATAAGMRLSALATQLAPS
jgi:hypothetical protein